MSVIFFGFHTWGLVTLRALHEAGHQIVTVVTHPDTEDRYRRHFTDSVAKYAAEAGFPTLIKTHVDSEVICPVKERKPDYIVSSNWGRILPAEVIFSPGKAAFNVHRSLLPRYAGKAPINWAIANGETRVGVTVHLMDTKVDLGDVVAQEGFEIGETETATEVFARTNPVVARLIVGALDACEQGRMRRRKTDPKTAEFFHVRGEPELAVDWRSERKIVHNLIRSQSDPFANAYTQADGDILKIKSARIPQLCYRGTPSRVVQKTSDGSAIVLCGASAQHPCQGLELIEVAIGDGPARPAAEVLRIGQYLGTGARAVATSAGDAR